MTDSKEQLEKDRQIIRYLLKCYPECTNEAAEDHAEFVDDMADLLLARTARAATER